MCSTPRAPRAEIHCRDGVDGLLGTASYHRVFAVLRSLDESGHRIPIVNPTIMDPPESVRLPLEPLIGSPSMAMLPLAPPVLRTNLSSFCEDAFVASRDLASATLLLRSIRWSDLHLSRIAKCGHLPKANYTSRKCWKFAGMRVYLSANPLSPLALREEVTVFDARLH